jgi:CelD/BcsL family acetyltransferase involved in cellulose biosynthesis
MTGCVLIDYEGLDWGQYLSRLKAKRRGNIKKQLKDIREHHDVQLEIVMAKEDFGRHFDEMIKIHEKRWEDDKAPEKETIFKACWREALLEQFDRGKAWYCRLILDGETASYHLGFIHGATFYAWHIGFDPKYARNHVGVMILGFMIPEFMSRGLNRIDYMAGDYDWKLAWSPEREVEPLWMLTMPTDGILTHVLNWYHYYFRDKMKEGYNAMMQHRMLRFLSRNLILFRRRLTVLAGR